MNAGFDRVRSSGASNAFQRIATVGSPIDKSTNAQPNFVGSICANNSSTESPQKIQTPKVIATEKAKRLQMALRKIDFVEGGLVTVGSHIRHVRGHLVLYTNPMTPSLLSIFITTSSAYNPTWAELKSEDGWAVQGTVHTDIGTVVVSKKMIDNFPCFRGVAEYNGLLDIPLMIEIAADAESAMEWSSAGVAEAETLAKTNEYAEYYQFLDLPFPMSDRYWFLRGYFEREGDVYYFRWKPLVAGGIHSARYQKVKTDYPDALETKINLGSWIVYSHDGKTHVEDRLCSHPNGSVPVSLQSIATSKTLPNNVAEIIKETKRRMAE